MERKKLENQNQSEYHLQILQVGRHKKENDVLVFQEKNIFQL